jgi:hypothetical protein
MNLRSPRVLFSLATLAIVLPLVPTLIAYWIADANHCVLDEGDVHSCLIFGIDAGETLYAMGMTFWFTFFTLPVGIIVMVVTAILEALARHRAKRRSR